MTLQDARCGGGGLGGLRRRFFVGAAGAGQADGRGDGGGEGEKCRAAGPKTAR